MDIGEYGPPARTRHCRGVRRRGAVPRAVLTVRHVDGGPVLVRARTAPGPDSTARPRRGAPAFATAAAALAGSVILLLTGIRVDPATAGRPCPPRTSTASYAGGRLLLVHAEPVRGGTALLHLCADDAIGPVRAWSVRIGPDASDQAAVQRVTDGGALAAVPLTVGRPVGLTVVVDPETGGPLTFAVPVTAS